MLTVLMSLAFAQPLPLEPGPGLHLVRCATAQASDPCWEQAQRLQRWGPLAGEVRAGLDAPVVALAHTGEAVVARASLPPGVALELTVLPSLELEDARLGAKADFALFTGDGPHLLPLTAPWEPGTLRAVRVQLVVSDGDDVRALPWTPSGVADPSVAVPALAGATATREVLPLGVRAMAPERLVLQAPADTWVELVQVQAAHRWGGAFAEAVGLDAWRAEGVGTTEVPWPEVPGEHELRALRGDRERPELLQVQRVRIPPRAVPEARANGLVPAPREVLVGNGRLRLAASLRICTEVEAVGQLLSRELSRTAGVVLVLEPGCDGPGTLVLSEGLEAPGFDGFEVEVRTDGATVRGATRLGLTYGALALSDLLATGSAEVGTVRDWGELEHRVVFWRADGGHGERPDPRTLTDFVDRVVLRSRSSLFVVMVRGAMVYPSHPELAMKGAYAPEDFAALVEHARALGVEVAPGVNTPGHADWLFSGHPEWAEDGDRLLMCTRHPEARATLHEVYADLDAAFLEPEWVHLGHDEAKWHTAKVPLSARCPRCSGTPRWELYREELASALDWWRARDTRVLTWDDMWVPGHNGDLGGTDRVKDLLSEAQLDTLALQSWSLAGRPIEALADVDVEHWRGATAYDDHKRRGLREAMALGVTGDGIALYVPAPWSASGGMAPERQLRFHLSYALVAGWTAWRPGLETRSIDEVLAAVRGHPAAEPGRRTRLARGRPLRLPAGEGSRPLARTVWADEVRFRPQAPLTVPTATPLVLPASGSVHALSLLTTIDAGQDAQRAWWSDSRQTPALEGLPAGVLRVRWTDGQLAEVPLTQGVDAWRFDQDVPLWGATVQVSTGDGGSWSRWDWVNPRPEVEVAELSLQGAAASQQQWRVAGATLHHNQAGLSR